MPPSISSPGFDVLYHHGVSDDVTALRELRRVVRPGGWGLVRVPALPALWSAHDEAVHARQRYWLGELRAKAEQAQWEVVRGTYANNPVAAGCRGCPLGQGGPARKPAATTGSRKCRRCRARSMRR